jgi:preprotein translocase subunit YajC
MSALIFLLLIVLMWVVLIVPRQREMRRHNALMRTLEEGDEVMMGSGIYGTILEMEDDFVTLEVAPDVDLKVAKRAIAAKVVSPQGETIDAESVDAEAIDLTGVDDDHGDRGPGPAGSGGA